MSVEGPPLEVLTRRLAETPTPFLAEPRIGNKGQVVVPALVADLLRRHGVPADAAVLARFAATQAATERNPRMLTQVLCWLLAAEELRGKYTLAQLAGLLIDEANALAAEMPAREFVEQAERREELARLALRTAGMRPAGESETVAADRWLGVSTRERVRLAAASRAAEERARQIREALARKAAEESADKWSRE
ncbi:MAG: hypothetical protein U1F26_18850 [Lysobacterales bacterium]